jgi:hypothetical protein
MTRLQIWKLYSVELNVKMLINFGYIRISKDVVVTCFNVPSWLSSRETGKDRNISVRRASNSPNIRTMFIKVKVKGKVVPGLN